MRSFTLKGMPKKYMKVGAMKGMLKSYLMKCLKGIYIHVSMDDIIVIINNGW